MAMLARSALVSFHPTSADKLALLCADGRIGRVSAGPEHPTRALKPQTTYSAFPLQMLCLNAVYPNRRIKTRHVCIKLLKQMDNQETENKRKG